MLSLPRDLTVWAARARECRNPLLWLSALNHDRQRYQLLSAATRQPAAQVANYLREIEDDAEFIAAVRERLTKWTSYQPRAIDFMLMRQWGSVFFNEVTLYAIARAVKPALMVETGGTPGKSTAFILRAMERNGAGHLYTIDLPPQTVAESALAQHATWHQAMPKGLTSGWVVPEALRARHTLLSGRSSDRLPPLLAQLGRIDIFLHDSDHSYGNMTWEFETAFPALKPGGLILSDDVLANPSFFDFCRKQNLAHYNVFNIGAAFARS